MRVRATIDEVTLENEDGYEVESVCATCSRCDHETESYGTGDASIRRCLVLLREECPNGEHNYYFDGAEQQRQSPVDAAYERGYADGRAAAGRARPTAQPQLGAEQLREFVTLCHPDRHPPERFEQANRATSALLQLLEQRRAA